MEYVWNNINTYIINKYVMFFYKNRYKNTLDIYTSRNTMSFVYIVNTLHRIY